MSCEHCVHSNTETGDCRIIRQRIIGPFPPTPPAPPRSHPPPHARRANRLVCSSCGGCTAAAANFCHRGVSISALPSISLRVAGSIPFLSLLPMWFPPFSKRVQTADAARTSAPFPFPPAPTSNLTPTPPAASRHPPPPRQKCNPWAQLTADTYRHPQKSSETGARRPGRLAGGGYRCRRSCPPSRNCKSHR